MQILILLFSLAMYAAERGNIYEHLVGSTQDFWQQPQHALERRGGELLRQTPAIEGLCQALGRTAKSFMAENAQEWCQLNQRGVLPFWGNIDEVRDLFTQNVLQDIDPIFKYIDEACFILKACDCMSYGLDTAKDQMDLERCLALQKCNADMSYGDTASKQLLDFSVRQEIDLEAFLHECCASVRYEITNTGQSCPLDFVAALKRHVFLVAVPSVGKGMHRLYIKRRKRNLVGAGEVLKTTFANIWRLMESWNDMASRSSEQLPSAPHILIKGACDLVCAQEDKLTRAKFLTVVFSNVYYSKEYLCRGNEHIFHGPQYIQTLRYDEAFCQDMIKPLCDLAPVTPQDMDLRLKNVFDQWTEDFLAQSKRCVDASLSRIVSTWWELKKAKSKEEEDL